MNHIFNAVSPQQSTNKMKQTKSLPSLMELDLERNYILANWLKRKVSFKSEKNKTKKNNEFCALWDFHLLQSEIKNLFTRDSI